MLYEIATYVRLVWIAISSATPQRPLMQHLRRNDNALGVSRLLSKVRIPGHGDRDSGAADNIGKAWDGFLRPTPRSALDRPGAAWTPLKGGGTSANSSARVRIGICVYVLSPVAAAGGQKKNCRRRDVW